MPSKYYAVRRGKRPGIYDTWDACSAQVTGFAGAQFKSFATRAEADAYLAGARQAHTSASRAEKAAPRAAPARPRTARVAVKPAEPAEEPRATIFTDGGCFENPGPGGYGAVVIDGGKRRELSGGFRRTTNNRMEMMACIAGLRALSHDGPAALVTDSRYVANSLSKGWAKRWRAAKWLRESKRVPNADLWAVLLGLSEQKHVSVRWVRGHAGHAENERCHTLATQALQRGGWPADEGYEREREAGLSGGGE
ncbi:MAG: viroplasmin family protein [Chloroflexi bacterium]|nr:viroplasmin family protein [Chloroflexota bacterium]